MIKYLFFICIIIFVACGDDEKLCRGQQGVFVASPFLSINNCLNIMPESVMEINIDEDSIFRECGWHDIGEEEIKINEQCYQKVEKSLNTLPDYYHGFIIVDLKCPFTCKTVWEYEFEKTSIQLGK
jgi:hypothetical protein